MADQITTFRPAYRQLSDDEKRTVDAIKSSAELLERHIKSAGPSRHQSLAMTKLEEAVMWAVKGVTG